jgi:hypothetical protein
MGAAMPSLHWNFDDSSSSSHSPVSRNKLMITGRRLFCPSTRPFTHPAQHQWTEIEKKKKCSAFQLTISYRPNRPIATRNLNKRFKKKKEESAQNYSKANVYHRRKEAFIFSRFRIFICQNQEKRINEIGPYVSLLISRLDSLIRDYAV